MKRFERTLHVGVARKKWGSATCFAIRNRLFKNHLRGLFVRAMRSLEWTVKQTDVFLFDFVENATQARKHAMDGSPHFLLRRACQVFSTAAQPPTDPIQKATGWL